MSARTFDRIVEIVGRGAEPDDVLREVVTALARHDAIGWAGIAFLEDGELVLGPCAGREDSERRLVVPIAYEDDLVGELRVDGDVDLTLVERVAEIVSPYVLIGWDTGGQAWEP